MVYNIWASQIGRAFYCELQEWLSKVEKVSTFKETPESLRAVATHNAWRDLLELKFEGEKKLEDRIGEVVIDVLNAERRLSTEDKQKISSELCSEIHEKISKLQALDFQVDKYWKEFRCYARAFPAKDYGIAARPDFIILKGNEVSVLDVKAGELYNSAVAQNVAGMIAIENLSSRLFEGKEVYLADVHYFFLYDTIEVVSKKYDVSAKERVIDKALIIRRWDKDNHPRIPSISKKCNFCGAKKECDRYRAVQKA